MNGVVNFNNLLSFNSMPTNSETSPIESLILTNDSFLNLFLKLLSSTEDNNMSNLINKDIVDHDTNKINEDDIKTIISFLNNLIITNFNNNSLDDKNNLITNGLLFTDNQNNNNNNFLQNPKLNNKNSNNQNLLTNDYSYSEEIFNQLKKLVASTEQENIIKQPYFDIQNKVTNRLFDNLNYQTAINLLNKLNKEDYNTKQNEALKISVENFFQINNDDSLEIPYLTKINNLVNNVVIDKIEKQFSNKKKERVNLLDELKNNLIISHNKNGNYLIEKENKINQTTEGKFVDLNSLKEQISKFIVKQIQQDISTAKISLKPDHLGSIEITISVHNDVVSATLKTDNLVTKNHLENSINQLIQSINDQGFQVNKIEVSANNAFQLMDMNNFQQQNKSKSNTWHNTRNIKSINNEAEENTMTNYLTSININNAIDYSI